FPASDGSETASPRCIDRVLSATRIANTRHISVMATNAARQLPASDTSAIATGEPNINARPYEPTIALDARLRPCFGARSAAVAKMTASRGPAQKPANSRVSSRIEKFGAEADRPVATVRPARVASKACRPPRRPKKKAKARPPRPAAPLKQRLVNAMSWTGTDKSPAMNGASGKTMTDPSALQNAVAPSQIISPRLGV